MPADDFKSVSGWWSNYTGFMLWFRTPILPIHSHKLVLASKLIVPSFFPMCLMLAKHKWWQTLFFSHSLSLCGKNGAVNPKCWVTKAYNPHNPHNPNHPYNLYTPYNPYTTLDSRSYRLMYQVGPSFGLVWGGSFFLCFSCQNGCGFVLRWILYTLDQPISI